MDSFGLPYGSVHARLRDAELRGLSRLRQGTSTRPRLLDLVSNPRMYHACVNTAMVPVPTYAAHYAPKATGTRFLATADEAGTVCVLDTDNDPESMLVARFTAHANAIFDVQWHPTDPCIATASGDQTVVLWDLERQSSVALFSAHKSSVRSVAFNPFDPAMLATTSRDGSIIIWDTRCAGVAMANGAGTAFGAANVIRHAHALPGSGSSAAAISVSAAVFTRERTVASAGAGDGVVREWDVRKLGSHNSRVRASPAAASCDLTEGRRARRFGLTHLALDALRDTLYAVGMDSRVYAVDATTLQPLRVYGSRHFTPSLYTRASVDPSGAFLAVGSTQHNALLFETARPDRAPLALRHGHTAEVSCVAFSQSSVAVRLATCSDDATVRIWREAPDDADRIRNAGAASAGDADLAFKSWACAEVADDAPAEFPDAWDRAAHGPDDPHMAAALEQAAAAVAAMDVDKVLSSPARAPSMPELVAVHRPASFSLFASSNSSSNSGSASNLPALAPSAEGDHVVAPPPLPEVPAQVPADVPATPAPVAVAPTSSTAGEGSTAGRRKRTLLDFFGSPQAVAAAESPSRAAASSSSRPSAARSAGNGSSASKRRVTGSAWTPSRSMSASSSSSSSSSKRAKR
ncbi:hypothetical protein H9P43_008517 [Blastocladiella emersonii ATCC 22665]|nr:hypothetical protein H9P43_008517 [Blastocladiella emersonii ATCC 22665]